MIREVSRDTVTYNDPPMKFEAGTPGIVQTIGLGVALDYLMDLGMDNVAAHEARLRAMPASGSRAELAERPGRRAGQGGDLLVDASTAAAHAHDISTILDKKGIAVRAGHHCAQPLMEHLGVTATARASFGLYNTTRRGRHAGRRAGALPPAAGLNASASAAPCCGRRPGCRLRRIFSAREQSWGVSESQAAKRRRFQITAAATPCSIMEIRGHPGQL